MSIKVLIPTVGTRGDVQPYIALAQKLDREGFSCTIATHPCWKNLIEGFGVDYMPIGPDIDIEQEAAAIRENAMFFLSGMIKTMKFVFNIMKGASSEISSVMGNYSFVVVSHSHTGAAEARAMGIPYVSVTLQPDIIPLKLKDKSIFEKIKNKAGGLVMNPVMAGPYNGILKSLGADKIKTYYDLVSPELNMIPISHALCPENEYWEEKNKVTGYWFTDDENYEPPEYLKEFLEAGDPPVVVSLGAMAFEGKSEIKKLDMFVGAIKKTGQRGIIQGFSKSIGDYDLPEEIIHAGSIPHSYLFKKAFLIFHHGGVGTTASALRAKVPSVIIPHVLDQFYWGKKVFDFGAGPRPVNLDGISQESLVSAIMDIKDQYPFYKIKLNQAGAIIESENGIEKAYSLVKSFCINNSIIS